MNFLKFNSLYCCEDIKSMNKKKLSLLCSYSSDTTPLMEPELHCWNDGQVYAIDNKLVAYSQDGNIQSIGGKEVKYNSNGEIHSIGGKVVNYFADGEIQSIGGKTVANWYDDNAEETQKIEKIYDNELYNEDDEYNTYYL